MYINTLNTYIFTHTHTYIMYIYTWTERSAGTTCMYINTYIYTYIYKHTDKYDVYIYVGGKKHGNYMYVFEYL